MLIGLHVYTGDDGNGEQQSSYRTLLVTFHDGKAQLAADLPDLIVPRKDGFWRVGTLHKGPPGKYGAQEFVYAVPARSFRTPLASISLTTLIGGLAPKPTKPPLSL